jgi:hypothetical protein
LIKTYKEIESGTHDSIEDRPKLRAAVAHARRSGATLGHLNSQTHSASYGFPTGTFCSQNQ